MASNAVAEGPLLIADLLRDQRDLTAVQRFSRQHESAAKPQARLYRDLIPLSAPKPGQQYAFEVDLDACTGCKSCVTACHNLNGLDDGETWRSVGALVGETKTLPMMQMVTASCHHCAHPACLDGCPVKAYEKDAVTGIVKHLDDQCIGCQYCVMKCPYDAPKYNPRQGIVRKCDMCSSRLEVGEAPACVQACPGTAIRITVVDVVREPNAEQMLPGTPDPAYTHPTTQYKRRVALPSIVRAADAHRVAPEPAHLSLVFMLILTQLSVGSFAIGSFVTTQPSVHSMYLLSALIAGVIGMNCAVLHLGRPLYAFRALLGLRTSWLSREIAAFGLFAPLAAAYTASTWFHLSTELQFVLHSMTVFAGLVGVFCSAMIYADTRRPFWNLPSTAAKFFLSAAICACAVALPLLLAAGGSHDVFLADLRPLYAALAALAFVKLTIEALIFRKLFARGTYSLQRKSAILLARDLGAVTCIRFGLGLAGGILLPLAMLVRSNVVLAIAVAALTIAGELLERYLFFRAVVALKMPGEAAQ